MLLMLPAAVLLPVHRVEACFDTVKGGPR